MRGERYWVHSDPEPAGSEHQPCSARSCVVCREPAHTPGEECDAGEHCRTRAVHLGMTCRRCYQRMDDQLRELPELYALAAAELAPTGSAGTARSGSERSIGVRLAALDLRAGIDLLGTLGAWERDWREHFADPAPAATPRARSDRVGANLVATAGWLRANLHRSCRAHPAIDVFAAELAEAAQQARIAARTAGRRHVWVDCPTDTATGRCGAPLRITGLDLTDTVHCRTCRVTRDVHRLLLVAASDSQAGVWLPAEDVALLLGIPERTLRDWARRGLIRRQRGRYDLQSVRAAIQGVTTRRTGT